MRTFTKALRCRGVITNGGVRDIQPVPVARQVYSRTLDHRTWQSTLRLKASANQSRSQARFILWRDVGVRDEHGAIVIPKRDALPASREPSQRLTGALDWSRSIALHLTLLRQDWRNIKR